MALSKPTHVPLLLISCVALFVLAPNKVHSQDTTSFTFDSFPSQPTDLIYQGDASVPSGSTFLRLTKTDASGNPATESIGRVLYSSPVQFWEAGRQASFETTIRFLITPVVNSNPADGLAFFVAPVGTSVPAYAGLGLGITDQSGTSASLFAVEFDTYTNAALEDPEFPHVGIDVNSLVSRNITRFDSMVGKEVTARVNYEATTRRITATVTVGSDTVTVSDEFDLKTVLPQQVQVGVSASTGGQVEINDLHSWYFTSTLVNDPNSIRKYAGF